MVGNPRLTPTSYIVLGLLELGEATPYDLKTRAASSIGNFWSVPHSALYAEPDRLTAAGYLTVEQEPDGLRRKRYSITASGRAALDEWRSRPSPSLPQIRDESLLKLFFGADPRAIAAIQRDAHREKLAAYEARARDDDGSPPRGPWRTLAAGIAHEREWVRYWSELADGEQRGRR
jgi:PadR family transcriptional regulator AphA